MSTSCVIIGKKTIRKVFNYSTDDSLNELTKHIMHNLVIPDMFDRATVDYDVSIGLPVGTNSELFNDPTFFPLKFFAKDGSEVLWISSVSAGFRGTGPLGAIEALEIMGFPLSERQKKELLTSKTAHFTYYK